MSSAKISSWRFETLGFAPFWRSEVAQRLQDRRSKRRRVMEPLSMMQRLTFLPLHTLRQLHEFQMRNLGIVTWTRSPGRRRK